MSVVIIVLSVKLASRCESEENAKKLELVFAVHNNGPQPQVLVIQESEQNQNGFHVVKTYCHKSPHLLM